MKKKKKEKRLLSLLLLSFVLLLPSCRHLREAERTKTEFSHLEARSAKAVISSEAMSELEAVKEYEAIILERNESGILDTIRKEVRRERMKETAIEAQNEAIDSVSYSERIDCSNEERNAVKTSEKLQCNGTKIFIIFAAVIGFFFVYLYIKGGRND